MKVDVFKLVENLRKMLEIYLGQEVSEEEYEEIVDEFRKLIVRVDFKRDKKEVKK